MSEPLFIAAIECMAKNSPNSVLGDLLAILPKDSVVKLVESFSGEYIKVPKIDAIWAAYRNNIIRESLDNSNTRVVRRKLAEYFGITPEVVCKIYQQVKAKQNKLSPEKSEESIRRIVASKHEDVLSGFREALRLSKKR